MVWKQMAPVWNECGWLPAPRSPYPCPKLLLILMIRSVLIPTDRHRRRTSAAVEIFGGEGHNERVGWLGSTLVGSWDQPALPMGVGTGRTERDGTYRKKAALEPEDWCMPSTPTSSDSCHQSRHKCYPISKIEYGCRVTAKYVRSFYF